MRSQRRSRKPAHDDSVTSLTPEEIRARTFQRAVKLLTTKPRSIAELRERLLEGKSTSEEAVEEVITRLREYGYLDDERFAFGYASLKVRQRPLGRARVSHLNWSVKKCVRYRCWSSMKRKIDGRAFSLISLPVR